MFRGLHCGEAECHDCPEELDKWEVVRGSNYVFTRFISFELSVTVGFRTFVQQDLGWDLSHEISACEEGGEKIVLVAMEVQVLFHAGDIGVCFDL